MVELRSITTVGYYKLVLGEFSSMYQILIAGEKYGL